MTIRDYIAIVSVGSFISMNAVLLYCFIQIWLKGSITLVESSVGIRTLETIPLVVTLIFGIITAVKIAVKIGNE
jgi:hypothetical protein